MNKVPIQSSASTKVSHYSILAPSAGALILLPHDPVTGESGDIFHRAGTLGPIDGAEGKALAELDSRLDEIEREMIAPAADGDGTPAKRRQ